jgi:hypothetical protein
VVSLWACLVCLLLLSLFEIKSDEESDKESDEESAASFTESIQSTHISTRGNKGKNTERFEDIDWNKRIIQKASI